jgi:hypothetical protein
MISGSRGTKRRATEAPSAPTPKSERVKELGKARISEGPRRNIEKAQKKKAASVT